MNQATIGMPRSSQLVTKIAGGAEALAEHWQPCHVGVIIRNPPKEILDIVDELEDEEGESMRSPDDIYILESTPEFGEEGKNGTCISPLEYALDCWTERYSPSDFGLVFRSVEHVKSEQDSSTPSESKGIECKEVWNFVKEAIPKNFCFERTEIFEIIMERWLCMERKPKPDLSRLYSAELASRLLQLAGVLKTDPAANSYLPRDFLPNRKIEENICCNEDGTPKFVLSAPLNISGFADSNSKLNLGFLFWHLVVPVFVVIILRCILGL